MSLTAEPVTFASLTGFDWVLVVCVVVSAAMAFRRGLIRVLFSFAGLVAGLIVASWNYLQVGAGLHAWVANVATAQILAFLAILLAVWFVFAMIAAFVRRAVKAVGLGFADRMLGAAFGVARGVLLGIAAMMALVAFAPESSWMKQSVLAPYFLEGAHAVSFIVPQHFEKQMSEGARHLLKKNSESLKQSTTTK